MFRPVLICLAALGVAATAAQAQGASSTPIKAGLWETTITSTSQIQLPPEVQARIDAMPPQQQAMMKLEMDAMMDGGAPTTTTMHSCSTGQTIQDLMNQAQQIGASCKLTNQTQTATGVSFDITCTMQPGTAATGHSSFTLADSDHVSGTTHMTVNMTTARGSGAMNVDSTVAAHYLSADCGSVQPNSAVVVTK